MLPEPPGIWLPDDVPELPLLPLPVMPGDWVDDPDELPPLWEPPLDWAKASPPKALATRSAAAASATTFFIAC
jgi:hypothetical protein